MREKKTVSQENGALGKFLFSPQTVFGLIGDPFSVCACLFLLIASFLLYIPVLDGPFVADDIWQVSFAHNFAQGNHDLFWRNFQGRYLELPGFEFYRPFLGLSFILDYQLWGLGPQGYHLFNSLVHSLSGLLIFAVFRDLTSCWPRRNSIAMAFFTALTFLFSSLHCEAVAWISGRADPLALFFVLISMLFLSAFSRNGDIRAYVCALFCFGLALASKEMASILVFLLPGYLYLLTGDCLKTIGVFRLTQLKVNSGILLAWLPFLLLLLAYLGLRLTLLESPFGGYSGMIGGSLDRHLLWRWFDPLILKRILLPFPVSSFSGGAREILLWTSIFAVGLSSMIAIIRLSVIRRDGRLRALLAFLAFWSFIAILPVARMWGIGIDLETSRLLYFFTLPASAILPLLLFYPLSMVEENSAKSSSALARAESAAMPLSAFLLSLYLSCLAISTIRVCQSWKEAGEELSNLTNQVRSMAEKLPSGKRMILLGIPKAHQGAHVNFNGSTFHKLLRPPFVDQSLSERVLTFEPFIVGPAEVINAGRLQAAIKDPDCLGPYVWNRLDKRLALIDFSGEIPDMSRKAVKKQLEPDGRNSSADSVVFAPSADGQQLSIDDLSVNPLSLHMLEFEIDASFSAHEQRYLVPCSFTWTKPGYRLNEGNWTEPTIALHVDKLKKGKQKLQLRLSRYWRWYERPRVEFLQLRLFSCPRLSISAIALSSEEGMIPRIWLKDEIPLSSGEFLFYAAEKKAPQLLFDCSDIDGASSAQLEISATNYFFDNFLGGTGLDPCSFRLGIDQSRGVCALSSDCFPRPGYYEIRLRALDFSGRPASQWSDSIVILKIGENGEMESYVK